MAQQVLVEDGSGQVSKRVSGANMQLRRSIWVFSIDYHETGRRRIGQIDEDVIVGKRRNIVQVMIDGLQRVAVGIDIVG